MFLGCHQFSFHKRAGTISQKSDEEPLSPITIACYREQLFPTLNNPLAIFVMGLCHTQACL